MTIMQIVMFRMYSVASLVGPRLEETVLATLLRKIFKRPSILGQKGHRYPPKHSKVSYYHFDGWLETSNHRPSSLLGSQATTEDD